MKAIPTPTRKQCERVAHEVQQEAMLIARSAIRSNAECI